MGTQNNMKVMYHRVVYLIYIILLTNVAPINLIKRTKKAFQNSTVEVGKRHEQTVHGRGYTDGK